MVDFEFDTLSEIVEPLNINDISDYHDLVYLLSKYGIDALHEGSCIIHAVRYISDLYLVFNDKFSHNRLKELERTLNAIKYLHLDGDKIMLVKISNNLDLDIVKYTLDNTLKDASKNIIISVDSSLFTKVYKMFKYKVRSVIQSTKSNYYKAIIKI